MNSHNLNPGQRADLVQRLKRQHDQLFALLERMNELRFPTDDPVWSATRQACKAMTRLIDAARSSGKST